MRGFSNVAILLLASLLTISLAIKNNDDLQPWDLDEFVIDPITGEIMYGVRQPLRFQDMSEDEQYYDWPGYLELQTQRLQNELDNREKVNDQLNIKAKLDSKFQFILPPNLIGFTQ